MRWHWPWRRHQLARSHFDPSSKPSRQWSSHRYGRFRPRPGSTTPRQRLETRGSQFPQVVRPSHRPSISRRPRSPSRTYVRHRWQSSSTRHLLEPSGVRRMGMSPQNQVDLTRSTPNSRQSQRRSLRTCGDCPRKPGQSSLRPNRICGRCAMRAWVSWPPLRPVEWLPQRSGLELVGGWKWR